jgi:hypothetical protein
MGRGVSVRLSEAALPALAFRSPHPRRTEEPLSSEDVSSLPLGPLRGSRLAARGDSVVIQMACGERVRGGGTRPNFLDVKIILRTRGANIYATPRCVCGCGSLFFPTQWQNARRCDPAACRSMALPLALPRPTRFVFWLLICGALLLLLDDLTDSSAILSFQVPPSVSSFRRRQREPPSLPIGNRRRPRNAHPVPVLGPPLSPTDTLSTDPFVLLLPHRPSRQVLPRKVPHRLHGIRFGRISNARLLVGDMAGLGIVLNRTVILPHLDACGNEGHDGVWDLDALRVPGILSGIGLDVQRLCRARPGDRLYDEPPQPAHSQTSPPSLAFSSAAGNNPWEWLGRAANAIPQ